MSRMRCGTISAFTRVFDALWCCSAEPGPALYRTRICGPRISSAPLTRCAASGERKPAVSTAGIHLLPITPPTRAEGATRHTYYVRYSPIATKFRRAAK